MIKKKLSSWILSFTVLTVTAAVIHCSCAFADVSPISQEIKPPSAMGHCDQHKKASTSKKSSKDCCSHCESELGVLNSQDIDFYLLQDNRTFASPTFSVESFISVVNIHQTFQLWYQRPEARSVSTSDSAKPLYIVFRSLLI